MISVPGNSAQEITRFTVDVSKFVDHLDKKHAIFLVAEGEGGEELFDLIGLGFSSKKKDIARPVVPEVNIAVNGNRLGCRQLPYVLLKATVFWDMTCTKRFMNFRQMQPACRKCRLRQRIRV